MESGRLEFCELLTATEDCAVVLWKSATPGRVEFRCGHIERAMASEGRLRRCAIGPLQPDTEYVLTAARQGRELKTIRFRTLPRPKEKPLLTFAVVADPHVSFGKESEHGRLFHQSRQILGETVVDINREGVDLVILPGDISEDGLESEMREAAAILAGLDCPYLPVFGDHELVGNTPGVILEPDAQRRLWCDIFGRERTFYIHRQGGLLFVCVDTSEARLGPDQLNWLREIVTSNEEDVVIAGHHGLCRNPAIMDADFATSDAGDTERLIRGQDNVMAVFTGHKNVPSLRVVNGACQISCPQICQFPCGYLLVRVYPDRWTYYVRPIRDDDLMESSYLGGKANGRPQWDPAYRIGRPDGRYGARSRPTA